MHSKTYLNQPLTQPTQAYLGEELTEVLQVEQMLVNTGHFMSFADWSLNPDCEEIDITDVSPDLISDDAINRLSLSKLKAITATSLTDLTCDAAIVTFLASDLPLIQT